MSKPIETAEVWPWGSKVGVDTCQERVGKEL